MADRLRILIADDTAFFRRVVAQALEAIPGVQLVAVVENGRLAVERIAQGDVQLAILDIEMPELDGLSAAREIAQKYPGVQVAILSATGNAQRTMEALANGALELIRKPEGEDAYERLRASLARVIDSARAAREASERKRARAIAPVAPKLPATPRVSSARARRAGRKFDLLLIGVSTGGPQALLKIIPRLPANLPCPVLVVQHMSAGFTASLAESIARSSQLPVREAAEGDLVEPGRVLLAPGGLHMEIERRSLTGSPAIRISNGPPVNGCRPAVDVLWSSVAASFRGEVLGVVLTGMGCDGREGMRALRTRGAYCVAQDEPSSVVWGMPGAVVEAGLADEVHALDDIAARLESLVLNGSEPCPS